MNEDQVPNHFPKLSADDVLRAIERGVRDAFLEKLRTHSMHSSFCDKALSAIERGVAKGFSEAAKKNGGN